MCDMYVCMFVCLYVSVCALVLYIQIQMEIEIGVFTVRLRTWRSVSPYSHTAVAAYPPLIVKSH